MNLKNLIILLVLLTVGAFVGGLLSLVVVPASTVHTGTGEVHFSQQGEVSFIRDNDAAPSVTMILDTINNFLYLACYEGVKVYEDVIFMSDGGILEYLFPKCEKLDLTPWPVFFAQQQKE